MFNQIFQRPKARKLHFNTPLLEERLRYLTYLAEQGYKLSTLQEIASYQQVLIKYLRLEEAKILTFEEITSAAHRWALYARRHYRYSNACYSKCKRRFIRCARQWLHFLGRLEIPIQPLIPIEITEFAEYMRNEKGLSEVTILENCQHMQRIFKRIQEKPKQFLAQLTAEHVDNLVIQESDKGIYTRRTIQCFAIRLRYFLRYAEYRGWCRLGIADSIRIPRGYEHQTLPSSPSWDDVQRLLKNTEGNHPGNIRDRAILLLLVVYGLRDSEVRRLRFDDLDWENETIHIKRSKHGPIQQFPLIQSVGQSLAHYIKDVRPQDSPYSNIFLTLRAPSRPLKTLYTLVSCHWKPLDVAIKHHGPHSLRHACATRLINQGMSIKTIADQLGHRSLETTRIYAKVDLTSLREVANFNIGGLS